MKLKYWTPVYIVIGEMKTSDIIEMYIFSIYLVKIIIKYTNWFI